MTIRGLTGQSRAPRLQVTYLGHPKGRGVLAKEPIAKGTYICEYRTYRVYPVGSDTHKRLSEEYSRNSEGSFVVETAYPIPGIGRLCFDATRRYRDVGRYINHHPRHYNSKLSTPKLLRGKWRIALVSIKDIEVGEEVLYDYGERTQPWMRVRRESGGREEREEAMGDGNGTGETAGGSRDWEGMGNDVVGGSGDQEGTGEGGVSEGGSDVVVLESSEHDVVAASEKSLPQKTRRNSFWCPVMDCPSGPVQKMTQHLIKVHKMDHSRASKVSVKKVRAPLEAVRLRLPNPTTRSSRLVPLPLAVASTAAPSATSSLLSRTTHLPSQCTSASTSHHTPTPPHTVHTGGQFLNGFFAHLQTHAGGHRSRSTATQLVRDVAKYLTVLNPNIVEEQRLLEVKPVQGYLDGLTTEGMGPSGILHRLLSHKAAVCFMKLTVNCVLCVVLLACIAFFP